MKYLTTEKKHKIFLVLQNSLTTMVNFVFYKKSLTQKQDYTEFFVLTKQGFSLGAQILD